MKASKNNQLSFWKLVVIAFGLIFTSCASYQDKTTEMQTSVFDGNFKAASTSIDKNDFLLKKRNKLLYLLEKGKIEHLNANYLVSNDLFEQAYILIDDKISNNVGQAIASNLTSPMAEVYKGEDFEKVLIHYYKALNFFQLGDREAAIVEAKRINIRLLKLNENYNENKNNYAKDAFSQIVLGILFEANNEINDAFIAYRNAEEIYAQNNGVYFEVPIPEQLKIDLQRTAKTLGFTEDYNQMVKKYGKKDLSKKISNDEAIIFWENGLGPAKDQIKLTASGAGGMFVGTYDDDMSEIIIPIPANANLGINAIAIPKYKQRKSYYSKASLIVNNIEQKFETCQSLYPIAKQCLKDRMLREVIKIAIRYGTKKAVSKGLGFLANQFLPSYASNLTSLAVDAVNTATEKADTRNWQTLPATISYIRIPIKEGKNSFVMKKYSQLGVDSDSIFIDYKKGLQIVNYSDLGRSTEGYTTSVAASNSVNTNSRMQNTVKPTSELNATNVFSKQENIVQPITNPNLTNEKYVKFKPIRLTYYYPTTQNNSLEYFGDYQVRSYGYGAAFDIRPATNLNYFNLGLEIKKFDQYLSFTNYYNPTLILPETRYDLVQIGGYALGYLPINYMFGKIDKRNTGFFPYVKLAIYFTQIDNGSLDSDYETMTDYNLGLSYKFTKSFGLSFETQKLDYFGISVLLN